MGTTGLELIVRWQQIKFIVLELETGYAISFFAIAKRLESSS